MQMTYEQAMRPGFLQAFAARRGSGYMMRSEKRSGSYGNGSRRRPPRRRRAGFFYIFMTLLICVILWPVGMVMLWRRKVRMQVGTKLLISLLTLCLSVFLIVFALTVPVDHPGFTAFQDKANDWLDKAGADVAVAGDAALKKSAETWHVVEDCAQAGSEYALLQSADAIDKGVELAGQARVSIEKLIGRDVAEPTPTDAPPEIEPTEAATPEAAEPTADNNASAVLEALTGGMRALIPTPEAEPNGTTEEPSEAPTEAVSEEPSQAPTEEPTEVLAGLDTDEPTEEPTDEPTEEPTEQPTDEPTEEPTEAPTEAPTDEPTEAPTDQPTDEPTKEPTEAPTEAPTEVPTEQPTEAPTERPTDEPTEAPTDEPTEAPTEAPAGDIDIHLPDAAPDPEDAQALGDGALHPGGDFEPAEEAPQPEQTPAETPEAVQETPEPAFQVKPAGQATVYFYENGSKGFHRTPTSHGMNGAPAHTLAEAFAAGKARCNSCGMPDEGILEEEHIAWVDGNNVLHTTDECGSFAGEWRLMSLADALDSGCEPCPYCGADLYAESVFPAPTATPEPLTVSPSAALKSAGEITVYYYGAGKGYHAKPDCYGMNNAPAHTLAEAVAAGKRACGTCKPVSAELIGLPMLWLDENGLCHTTDECSDFSGRYRLIHRDDAIDQGLPACSECGAAEYLVPGTVLAGE